VTRFAIQWRPGPPLKTYDVRASGGLVQEGYIGTVAEPVFTIRRDGHGWLHLNSTLPGQGERDLEPGQQTVMESARQVAEERLTEFYDDANTPPGPTDLHVMLATLAGQMTWLAPGPPSLEQLHATARAAWPLLRVAESVDRRHGQPIRRSGGSSLSTDAECRSCHTPWPCEEYLAAVRALEYSSMPEPLPADPGTSDA
jgi:hypothetical protein